MSAKLIAVINYKGGVGKTTTTYNLGVAMSYLSAKKVLLIDLDPQCSLSNICLKSYSKKVNDIITLKNIEQDGTFNHVIRQYLLEARLRIPTKIDLDKIIYSNFYCGTNEILKNLDFIPTTMFDYTEGEYPEGLDNLEIKTIMQSSGQNMEITRHSMFAKFFYDYELMDKYDFIIFDCPPANSIMTQNVLAIADYYLVPTIMDELSTNGIPHLHYLIQKTIYNQLFKDMISAKKEFREKSYFDLINSQPPEILGILETLRKNKTSTTKYRKKIEDISGFKSKIFQSELKHYKGVSEAIAAGLSVFSVQIEGELQPKSQITNLLKEIYERIGVECSCIDSAKSRVIL